MNVTNLTPLQAHLILNELYCFEFQLFIEALCRTAVSWERYSRYLHNLKVVSIQTYISYQIGVNAKNSVPFNILN